MPPERLDSWKEIAEYLQRDAATVRRWEKVFGLPVHRVPGGRGHSVFAFPSEIDSWLKAGRLNEAPVASGSAGWKKGMAAVVLAGVVATVAWLGLTPRLAADDLRVEASLSGVIARDTSGRERWRHSFSPEYRTILADPGEPLLLVTGENPAVYLATGFRVQNATSKTESGVLTRFGIDGVPQSTFSFDDRVTFGGTAYGPPWAISSFAIDDSRGQRRLAVTAHHWLWDPGLVAVLDGQSRRVGTFAHAGWIDKVHWLSPDRLLVNGFSNAREGGMIALLDPDALDGNRTEPEGSRYRCDTCSDAGPIRMIVMPRSEVNQASSSPFNRAVVQISDDRITARTIEVPSDGRGAVDVVYEFTAALDLIRASFSERYWEGHRALEAQGKLKHDRAACPDREGPRSILEWRAATGWTERAVPSSAR